MTPPRPHSVVELDADLLLVHKPQGHTEPEHSHDCAQTLRVLRGCLVVRTGTTETRLDADSAPLRIARGTVHATRATEATWLVVERHHDANPAGAGSAPFARP